MKEEKIHVGALVKDFVKENNINASELARKLGNIPVFVELLVRLFICTTLNIHNCISANEPVPISDYYATYYTHSEQN